MVAAPRGCTGHSKEQSMLCQAGHRGDLLALLPEVDSTRSHASPCERTPARLSPVKRCDTLSIFSTKLKLTFVLKYRATPPTNQGTWVGLVVVLLVVMLLVIDIEAIV